MQEETKNYDRDEDKLDLYDLLKRFRRHLHRYWVLVLALVLVFSGLSFWKAKRNFVPVYETQAVFTVSSGYSGSNLLNTAYYDNAAAQQLATAFPHLLNTDIMRDLMKVQLNKPAINGTIWAESAVDTNLFTLHARSTSAQDAYDILCAAIECYPQVAVYMVDDPGMIIRQEPEIPEEPANQFDWKHPVTRGAGTGLVLGLILLVVLTMTNQRITTVKQLKSLMNLPILAIFPYVRQKKRRSGNKSFAMASMDRAMNESVRALSAKLQKQFADEAQKTILVTSTLSGEGKTTIAANLAEELTKKGSKVVLVDADFRKQSVSERLGQPAGRLGLLDCMKNSSLPLEQCLRTDPKTSLTFLSGKSADSRKYSIDPKGMRRVLEELSQMFDYVILDTAPCAEVSDTMLLCSFVKSVVYVVRPEVPRQSQLLDVVNGLYDQGARLSGFVVNGVDQKSSNYGYQGSYGYRYGYKYGSKYGSSYSYEK